MIKAGNSVILKFNRHGEELCRHNGKAYTYETMEQAKRYLGAGEQDAILLEYVPKLKWIPVAEQLPPEDGWYIVWTKTKAGGIKSFNKAYFLSGYGWNGSGGHWTNVTHWMPLIPPPDDN